MPTTAFLMLAAACFARSSRRLEEIARAHHWFGGALGIWQNEGAISRFGKLASCSGVIAGYALYFWIARPPVVLAFPLGGTIFACAAWIASRPLPRRER